MPQRRRRKSRRTSSLELAVRPTTFRPNRQRHRIRRLPAQHVSQRLRLAALRKHHAQLRIAARRKRLLRRRHRPKSRRAHPSRLLRRLHQYLFPTLAPLLRRRNQRLVAARRRQRQNVRHAQLCRLLQTPLEPVELHQRDQQIHSQLRFRHHHWFHQRKFNPVLAAFQHPDAFHAPQPPPRAVAQFIQLPRLRPQHAPQMLRRVPAQSRRRILKLFNEKSPPHGEIVSGALQTRKELRPPSKRRKNSRP